LLAVVALTQPWLFAWVGPKTSRILLVSLVFMMGTTSEPQDFRACAGKLRPLLVNFIACFAVLPAIALSIGRALDLKEDFLVGLVLMGGVNGGSASNLFALLAGGDVALSVLMTITTTIGAVICTPLVAEIFVGAFVPVDSVGMLRSAVEMVLFPLVCGVATRAALPLTISRLEPFIPNLGLGTALPLLGGVLAGNASAILSAGVSLHIAAISFHVAAGLIGYFFAAVTGSDERVRRTVAIEVAMKNNVFACILAAAHFDSQAVQIPAATACIWCPIIAAAMSAYWKLSTPCKSQNTTGHVADSRALFRMVSP